MKKLLFAALLSVGFLSCQKESGLNTSTNSESQSSTIKGNPGLGNYIITPCYKKKCTDNPDGYFGSYVAPIKNDDMAWIYQQYRSDDQIPSQDLWYIEYLGDGFVKFWSQKTNWLERQRVLDIDWRHPNPDESINAVMWTINGDSNQEWELIGTTIKDAKGRIISFHGVIMNNHRDKMLEIKHRDNYGYLAVDKKYSKSEEAQYYNNHGNFTNYKGSPRIWNIRLKPQQ